MHVQRLYYMGGRNFVVTNVPPIGCCPNQRDLNPSSHQECVASRNQLVQQYNQRFKLMLMELTATLQGSTFLHADVYHIVDDIMENYSSYGFEVVDKACCHILGLHGGLVPCLEHTKICPDRSKYLFWDWFHVTETANLIIAKRLLDGEFDDISPINIRALSQRA